VPKYFPQRLDLAAIVLISTLCLPLGLLLYGGRSAYPKVQTFSWQAKAIGAEDKAFILTFNRPMNWDSVAKGLRITPPLPGKFSSSGRRFVYTLDRPIPYGQSFQIALDGATEAAVVRSNFPQQVVQPFKGQFRSRDRAFVYIGVGGEVDGRLVLRNLTDRTTTILTPKAWVVKQFKAYPQGDRLLVGAVERPVERTVEPKGAFEQRLYTVSTGLGQEPTGQTKLSLDNAEAQILKFDLSANGESIVLQRYGRNKKAPVGLWVIDVNGNLRLLSYAVAGEFLVTPDGSAVTIAQNQGISVVPIAAAQGLNRIEYLPQLGMPLSFARDASSAMMVKFNPDATRSLFWVSNQGIQKELLKTAGYILQAELDSASQRIFCLFTKLKSGSDPQIALYVSAIDLLTGHQTDLLQRPGTSTGAISLAPDGSSLVFDEVMVSEQPTQSSVRNTLGQAISQSSLWILPLDAGNNFTATHRSAQKQFNLSLSGLQPSWLP
jgi:hypothetical protein